MRTQTANKNSFAMWTKQRAAFHTCVSAYSSRKASPARCKHVLLGHAHPPVPVKEYHSMKEYEEVEVVHDRPLYIVWPDVLSAVGKTSYGIGWGSSNRIKSSLFSYLFICICSAKSALAQSIKYKSYSKNNQQPHHSITSKMCFSTPHYGHPFLYTVLPGSG